MNILHVVLSGNWGGSETIAFDLSNELSSRGHNVAIAVKPTDGYGLEFYKSKTAESVELIDASNATEDLLARMPFVPDIVHGHLGPSFARMRATKGDFARVGHMHMRFYPTQHRGLDGVMAVAPWQLGDIPRHFLGDAYLIPNFTHAWEEHSKSSLRDDLRRDLGIPSSALVVGTTGRLNHDKGYDVLIEAIRLMRRTDIHCVIVGAGASEGTLRDAAVGLANLHFTGFRTDVSDILRTFDLYVSSSRADSFGLSLLEAMQAGLPVIATKTYGGMHLLENFPERLVDMEDPAALAHAIDRFAGVPAPRESYGLDRFSMEKSCSMLEVAYAEIIEKKLLLMGTN